MKAILTFIVVFTIVSLLLNGNEMDSTLAFIAAVLCGYGVHKLDESYEE
jgi:high-affinity Fe2+/Pb2+ permease